MMQKVHSGKNDSNYCNVDPELIGVCICENIHVRSPSPDCLIGGSVVCDDHCRVVIPGPGPDLRVKLGYLAIMEILTGSSGSSCFKPKG